MASKHRSFTEDRLDRIKPPSTGRDVYHDTTTPGLIVRVTTAGSKTYSVYKKLSGKPVRHTIGQVGAITLKAAREAAAAALGKMPLGVNPNVEKRDRAAKKVTMGELWAHYLESWAKRRKRSWGEDEKRYKRHLLGWEKRALASITKNEVEAMHDRVGKKSGIYEANRLRSLLHKMFAISSKVGFFGQNPVTGIERFTESSRERFLGAEELPAFFTALEKLRTKSPTCADALELCIWTGARKGNVISMEWSELNLNQLVWTIPGGKHKQLKRGQRALRATSRGNHRAPQDHEERRVRFPWSAPRAAHHGSDAPLENLASGCRLEGRADARFAAHGWLVDDCDWGQPADRREGPWAHVCISYGGLCPIEP